MHVGSSQALGKSGVERRQCGASIAPSEKSQFMSRANASTPPNCYRVKVYSNKYFDDKSQDATFITSCPARERTISTNAQQAQQ
jgi:hypothetical protein